MPEIKTHPASFRDPDGFVFWHNNTLYRQVNKSYQENYRLLKESGLYRQLTESGWLVKHQEIADNYIGSSEWMLSLQPEVVPVISYPYEWSFDMLKDAALRTLDIQKTAVEFGMGLKDATPFNIQFLRGKPVLIDTLSFEKYEEAIPWKAYRQFCECFLFPLLLTSYTKTSWQKMLAILPGGISVTTTAAALPFRSRWNLNVWLHVFLQKRIQVHAANKTSEHRSPKRFSKYKMMTLLKGLYDFVQSMRYREKQVWDNYYDAAISGDGYLNEKEEAFRSFIRDIEIHDVLDIGANDGYFSSIVAEKAKQVVATDITPNCINQLYLAQKAKPSTNILPLVIDIANPTPSVGFNNAERSSFLERVKPDVVMALALTHHLHFSNNVPLNLQAHFFGKISGKYLLIEFVPLEDEKVAVIKNRKCLHGHPYGKSEFEHVFSAFFRIHRNTVLKNNRTLYLMEKI